MVGVTLKDEGDSNGGVLKRMGMRIKASVRMRV